MKGFFIFFTFIISTFNVFLCHVASANDLKEFTGKILILKSKDSRYYDKTINAISNILTENSSLIVKNINDEFQPKNEKLIISLGSKAAKYSRVHYPNIEKILAFLTLQQSQKLGLKQGETHLLIEQSPKQYLEFTKIILPQKKVGVLFQKSIYKPFDSLKHEVKLIEINDRSNLISATREAIKSTDLLLALPNKNIYNRHTLKGILLSTYQNGTPLISYSPAHVKAGALAAIYASPLNLGLQIADEIKKIGASLTDKPSRKFASYFSFKINRRVAQSLELDVASDQKISRLLTMIKHND